MFFTKTKQELMETRDDTVVTESTGGDLLRALIDSSEITAAEAMNIPAFAACVNKIADTVSEIPINLYRTKGDDVAVVNDPRVRLINDDTGDTLSGVEFKRALTMDYLIGKGGYAYINRQGNKVVSLHYVDCRNVSFQANTDPIFKNYNILVDTRRFLPMDFLKVLRNSKNGYSGSSVINDNQQMLATAYQTILFEKNLVETGGGKKGFLKSTRTLADEAMTKLKEAWKSLYSNNSENMVILNNGLEFQEASSTPTELQLNENKKTANDDICKLFGMPPSIINGGATEEDKLIYIQYCINPILDEFCASLNRDLLLESEKKHFYFAADTKEFTKGDIQKRFAAYETGIKNGFMQIDEVRRLENMPPLGLNFVKFGLSDVFYDRDTGTFYTPNTNQVSSVDDASAVDDKNSPDDGDQPDDGGKGDEADES
ncbi:MAG: phage portal protein [Bacteroidales bacterium]|nr:phage portal protein [Bacteroidales bacterium]